MSEQNNKELMSAIKSAVSEIENNYSIVVPLREAYISDMQKDAGYNAITASEEFMSMIASGEVTARGIATALASGKIEKISTVPSEELISAINALDNSIASFKDITGSYLTSKILTVSKSRKTGSRGASSPGIDKVLSIDPAAKIELKDVGMSHPHIVGTLSNGRLIDIDCYAATLVQHVEKALGRA